MGLAFWIWRISDEWVGVQDMIDSAGVMALVLKELLGQDKGGAAPA